MSIQVGDYFRDITDDMYVVTSHHVPNTWVLVSVLSGESFTEPLEKEELEQVIEHYNMMPATRMSVIYELLPTPWLACREQLHSDKKK